MESLSVLREACTRPRYTSFESLPFGIYKVALCEKEKTFYGDRVKIEIPSQEVYIYLPERISKKLKPVDIECMNKQANSEDGLFFLYKGRDESTRNKR